MLISFIFSDSANKSIIEPQLSNEKSRFGQLKSVFFSPLNSINGDLSTDEFKTSLHTISLGEARPTDSNDLVSLLNSKTGGDGYTWTIAQGIITVTHTSAFTITENNFSKLVLGADFTTSSTSHTFETSGLYSYNAFVIYSNSLLQSKERDENKKYFASFPISGVDYTDGFSRIFDSQSLINRTDIIINTSTISDFKIEYGVRMNDGTHIKLTPSPTRPWGLSLMLTNETGLEI